MAFVASVAGCGSSDAPFGEYVGTWQYSQVPTASLSCPGFTPARFAPIGNKVFERAIGANIVDVGVSPIDGTACDFVFDVKDKIATVHASQVCTLVNFTVDPAMPTTMAPTQWRFTLLGPNLAEEVGSANLLQVATSADAQGNPVYANCDYSLMARLSRVSTD